MTVLVMMKGEECVDISVLRNPRHEQFAQLVATGKPPIEAYVCVGFSKAGAAPSATRLLRNAPVRARVEELQHGAAQNKSRDRLHIGTDLRHGSTGTTGIFVRSNLLSLGSRAKD